MSFVAQTLLYVAAAVAVVGALGAVVSNRPSTRFWLLGALAVGVGGMYLALSAAMVALVALVCYSGIALAVRGWPPGEPADARSRARQLAGPAAGWLLIFAVLVVVRIPMNGSSYSGGTLGSVLLARSLFTRDVLAGIAVAAVVMLAAMGAVLAHHSRRDRG